MRRRLALLVMIGALAAPVLAQTVPVDPAKPSEPAPVDPEFVSVLKMDGLTNRMTVQVSVADRGPFPFIVDTGAERSVVSRELAAYLKLTPGANVQLFDFVGASDVGTARVSSLRAGRLTTSAIEAPLLLMDDIGAPGMLGVDALQQYRVILDFGRRRLFLKPARRHADGEVVLPAETRAGRLIITKAWFEGQPIAVIIDTGSWLSIGNSAMLKLARAKPRFYGMVSAFSVTGREFRSAYVTVANVRIGPVGFDRFALAFADVEPFRRLGLADRPALILGMDSLRLFRRVELDFQNQEVGFSTSPTGIDVHDVCRGGSNCVRISRGA